MLDRSFCVAPMMGRTDRHFRYFLRLLSKHALLYTEMITAAALLHGNRQRLLGFDPLERPLALQLGGSNPEEMVYAAALAQEAGYDEVNINVGCPSDRVRFGKFGACLMAEPQSVAACVRAMSRAITLPITVKTRIGIDHLDSYKWLQRFISTVADAGCGTFIIHARKAWLKGLSPRQNREIPPLRYDRVYRLKRDFPSLEIIINGGITTLGAALDQLDNVDGVMLGRAIYHDPYLIAEVDRQFFATSTTPLSRQEVLQRYGLYMESKMSQGVSLSQMMRHIIGLYHGLPGARLWRRVLSEQAHRGETGRAFIERAIRHMRKRGAIAHVL